VKAFTVVRSRLPHVRSELHDNYLCGQRGRTRKGDEDCEKYAVEGTYQEFVTATTQIRSRSRSRLWALLTISIILRQSLSKFLAAIPSLSSHTQLSSMAPNPHVRA
jgi:hypothetical protein